MRLRRKIFIALGVILGGAILGAAIYHWYLRSVNEAYLVQLASQGEPMTLAQILPPAVPPSENSADVFLRATTMLEADGYFFQTNSLTAMLAVGPGKAAACSQQPAAVGYESTNSWEEVASALAQNKTALDLLGQVTLHPAIDFHIHYEHGIGDTFDFTNLHLPELKKSALSLSASIIGALHSGNVAGAVASQLAMLDLIYAVKDERLIVSEWVRIAMANIAQSSTWEILQSPGVTETQLASLQKDWERVDFIRGAQDALAMERLTGEITLTQWHSSTARFKHYLGLGKQVGESFGVSDKPESFLTNCRMNARIILWQYWWSYPDELRALKGYQVLLDDSRLFATNHCFLAAATNQQSALAALQITNLPDEFVSMFSSDQDFHSLLSQSILTLAGNLKQVMKTETARQMTITAIALERFKLAHGHYPNHLSGLIPEFLMAIPIDPVDGQPLRYRRQADGTFLLYSVGKNGVDDGGDPSPADHQTPKSFYWQNNQALDWVWPQATTADDIQFIYSPAKTAK